MSLSARKILLLGMVALLTLACEPDDNFDEGPFLSKRTEILSFAFSGLPRPVQATVDARNFTVTATVPFGTNRAALVPTIQVSARATLAPPSGVVNDFSRPTVYRVNAENGAIQEWTVIVNEGAREAQPVLALSRPVWNLSPSGTGVPSFFTPDGERGMAYGNNKLYVTNNNDKILVLDPNNGSQLGVMNMTGVDGGGPKIADVEVSADGSILACNTVEWTSDGGGPPTTFKIYRWTNENEPPSVFLTYTNTAYRMGDSFTVIGDVSRDAVILTTFGRKFLNPTDRGNIVFKWNVRGGVPDPEPQLITVAGVPTLTRFGSRPHAQMLSVNSNQIYVNGNDIDFTLANLDGSFVSRIPNGSRQLYDGFNSYFELFQFAGKTVIVTVFPRSAVESRLLVIDVTDGLAAVTPQQVILSQSFMVAGREIANVNASGAVAVNVIDDNNAEIYCLITNQALAKFTLTTELR